MASSESERCDPICPWCRLEVAGNEASLAMTRDQRLHLALTSRSPHAVTLEPSHHNWSLVQESDVSATVNHQVPQSLSSAGPINNLALPTPGVERFFFASFIIAVFCVHLILVASV